MSSVKFIWVCQSLHLKNMANKAANKRHRAGFEHLCEIKPLYQEIRDAGSSKYHPGQDIAIDDRTVATKGNTKQSRKNKLVI